LAIALHQRSIPCRIYEARSEDAQAIGSGVTLGPNGCQVLDKLGLLKQVALRCFRSELHELKDAEGNTTGNCNPVTEQLYGYKNHRLYRQALIEEMKVKLKECEVPVEYNARFQKVVDEADDCVTFLINGRLERATLLVGSDGINSAVRKHVTSELPEYMGLASVYGHVLTDRVPWPSKSFNKNATIQDSPGALFMAPEVPDGSKLMVGRQFAHPPLDRANWEALAKDKDKLCALICKDYDKWHPLAQSILDQVEIERNGLLLWSYHYMPKLARWSSPTGRVIIIGDAAHAIPPSSGQGVNQAFEDSHTLAVLLSSLSPKMNLNEAMDFWHGLRQKRIDRIMEMTDATNRKRLPAGQRSVCGKTDGDQDQLLGNPMKWLFVPTTEDDIATWISSRI